MDESLPEFALKAFFTLLVVVDPLGVAPNFVALTSEFEPAARNNTLKRALMIAFGVTLFFLLGGRWVLSFLGVTVHAFAISGGILLFVVSWPMLFGHRPGLQAPERSEQGGRGRHSDISVGDPTSVRSGDHHDDPAAHQSTARGDFSPGHTRRHRCGCLSHRRVRALRRRTNHGPSR